MGRGAWNHGSIRGGSKPLNDGKKDQWYMDRPNRTLKVKRKNMSDIFEKKSCQRNQEKWCGQCDGPGEQLSSYSICRARLLYVEARSKTAAGMLWAWMKTSLGEWVVTLKWVTFWSCYSESMKNAGTGWLRRHCKELEVKTNTQIYWLVRSAAGEGCLQWPKKEIVRGYLKERDMLSNAA